MPPRFDTIARSSGQSKLIPTTEQIGGVVSPTTPRVPPRVSVIPTAEQIGGVVSPGLSEGGRFAPKVFQPWGPYRSFQIPAIWENDAATIAAFDAAVAGGEIIARLRSHEQNVMAWLLRGVPQRNPGDPLFVGYATDWLRPEDPSVTSLLFKQAWVVARPPDGALDASVPSDGRVLPGGRVVFPPPCVGAAPIPGTKQPSMARSTEVRWAIERPQVSLQSSRGLVRGPLINHYADLPLAQWWFRVAHALATDYSIIEALDRTDPRTGRVAGQAESDRNPYGWEAQIYYVRAICEALAAAYNAMNIPWYIDPVARSLWRDWFAGHDARGEFEVETDSNEELWFRAREQCGEKRQVVIRARMNAGDVASAGPRVGQYVALTAPMWLAHNPGGESKNLEFLQRAGVMLVSSNDERDPYLAARAANRGFASSFPMWGVALLGFKNKLVGDFGARFENLTDEEKRVLRDLEPDVAGIFRETMFRDDWYAQTIHAPPLQMRDQIIDWRAGGYDPPGLGDAHVQVSIPLRWYLSWLREWTTSVCLDAPVSDRVPANLPTLSMGRRGRALASGIPRRDVWRILDDSMSYALQINLTWASKFGGNRRFVELLADKAETLATRRPPLALQAGSQIVGLVGSTIGNAVMPGVGSLIGSGVNFLGSLVGELFASVDCTSFGRDDLGRHKPVFERNYLDGDPEREEPPRMDIPIPPGFCRSLVGVPRTTPVILPGSDLESPPPPAPPPSANINPSWSASTVAIVGIGVVLAAVLSYVGYQYFSRSRVQGT